MANSVVNQVIASLTRLSSPEKAVQLARFFKTGKGQYGEGDRFLGVVVPDIRKVAKEYYKVVSLPVFEKLLRSPIHEVRLCALVILTYQYEKTDKVKKKQIFDIYLKNTKYINNWDLIDLTAPNIVGTYLLQNSNVKISRIVPMPNRDKRDPRCCNPPRAETASGQITNEYSKSKSQNDNLKNKIASTYVHTPTKHLALSTKHYDLAPILNTLAKSSSLWERRIAMLATFAYIRAGRHEETFAIAEILLYDTHDLIQKAVGWMLREVGKRVSKTKLREFLDTYAKTMPRTTLRYAIEHFDLQERRHYMLLKIR